MIKKLHLLIVSLLLAASASAQTIVDVQQWGGNRSDYIRYSQLIGEDLVVLGIYDSDTMRIGTGTGAGIAVNLHGQFQRHYFLARTTPAGEIKWIRNIGVVSANPFIMTDNANNIVVNIDSHMDTVWVTGNSSTDMLINTAMLTGQKRFVVFFDENGNLVHHIQQDSGNFRPNLVFNKSITTTFKGSGFVWAGQITPGEQEAVIGTDTFNRTNGDSITFELDNDWNMVNVTQQHSFFSNAFYDAQGNAYVYSSYTQPINTETGTLQLEPGHSFGRYIGRVSSHNKLKWAIPVSGSNTATIRSLKFDDEGNIYIFNNTGSGFSGATKAKIGDHEILSDSNITTSYLIKLSNSGNLLWSLEYKNSGGGVLTPTYDFDTAGNVYVTGTFHNSTTIGAIQLSGIANSAYIAKISSDGNALWAERIADDFVPVALTGNRTGELYLAGTSRGFNTPYIGPEMYPLMGVQDVFMVHLRDTTYITGIRNTKHYLNASVFPNPVINNLNIQIPAKGTAVVQIFDATGRLAKKEIVVIENEMIRLNNLNFSKGLYFVKVQINGAVYSAKFLKE